MMTERGRTPGRVVLYFLILLVSVHPVAALEPQANAIIVNNADVVLQPALAGNTTLSTALGGVSTRVVVQYANYVGRYWLPTLPSGIEGNLNATLPRVVVQYANVALRTGLAPAPDGLQTALGQVAPRVVFQYANGNLHTPLVFPGGPLCDGSAALISGVQVSQVTETGARVLWTTNRHADSRVEYGTVAGVYSSSASDSVVVETHVLTLSGLVADTTYYYRVRSIDQCGVSAYSAPSSFTTSDTSLVFLPLVIR